MSDDEGGAVKTTTWTQRMRVAASRQRAFVAGAVALVALVGVAVPLTSSAATGPYDGATIACRVATRVSVDVKGNGFPGHSPVKIVMKSLGKVVLSASTTTSASGSFSSLLTVPTSILSGEITATTSANGTVVKASCMVTLRL